MPASPEGLSIIPQMQEDEQGPPPYLVISWHRQLTASRRPGFRSYPTWFAWRQAEVSFISHLHPLAPAPQCWWPSCTQQGDALAFWLLHGVRMCGWHLSYHSPIAWSTCVGWAWPHLRTTLDPPVVPPRPGSTPAATIWYLSRDLNSSPYPPWATPWGSTLTSCLQHHLSFSFFFGSTSEPKKKKKRLCGYVHCFTRPLFSRKNTMVMLVGFFNPTR